MTRLEVLDPTQESIPQEAVPAPRPDTLDGKVLGLLSNGKRNSDRLLDVVYSLLQDTYEFGDVVRVNKRDSSRPAPKHIMDELMEKCDLVITATGD